MKPDIRFNVIYIHVFIGLIAITWQDYKSLTSVWTDHLFQAIGVKLLLGIAPAELVQPVFRT
jgi:hypothetical protein